MKPVALATSLAMHGLAALMLWHFGEWLVTGGGHPGLGSEATESGASIAAFFAMPAEAAAPVSDLPIALTPLAETSLTVAPAALPDPDAIAEALAAMMPEAPASLAVAGAVATPAVITSASLLPPLQSTESAGPSTLLAASSSGTESSSLASAADPRVSPLPRTASSPAPAYAAANAPSGAPSARSRARSTSGLSSGASRRSGSGGAGTGDASSTPPRYRDCPAPPYPFGVARIDTTVLLLVAVDAAGRVTSASVLRGSGQASFDSAALRAVRAWRFEPARAASGQALAATVEVPIRFRARS